MKVSIVTPSLDAEAHIGDCLRSVREQAPSPAAIEHLVMDGESRDRTAELARAGGATVRVARDGSLYEALNEGVRRATGDWILWLNADDVLAPDAVARIAGAVAEAPRAELVVGDYALLRDGRRTTVRSPPDALDRIRAGRPGRAWVVPMVAVFRAATLRALGPYSTRWRVSGDLDMWLRAAARSPPVEVARIQGVLGAFRVHPGSLSMGGAGEAAILREAMELARAWLDDASAPRGVRDFARYLLRRNAYVLETRKHRDGPSWRRKLATAACWARWRGLGPGTLRDFFTDFY